MLSLAALPFKPHDVMLLAISSYMQCNQLCEARVLCTALQPVSVVTCNSYCHLSFCESCVWQHVTRQHGRLTVHNSRVLLPARLQTIAKS